MDVTGQQIKIKLMLLVMSVVYSVFAFSYEVTKDTTINDRLDNYVCTHSTEKLYLHQDRTCYVAGETIWFNLYQILSSSARNASGVAYVDMIDGKSEVVAQAKYPLLGGQASGSLDIPAELSTGSYQIRAYTQWMLNEGIERSFRRELKIQGLSENEIIPAIPYSEIRVQFFAEGGRLIEGLASKVALEAVDSSGKGIKVKGVILNTKKEVVQHFQTNAEGRGSFFFQPQSGQRYFAKIADNDKQFDFPEAQRFGFVLTLKRFKEVLRISLEQNIALEKKSRQYSLVFHQGDRVWAQLSVSTVDARSIIDVPIDKLPAGVFTVTLIDEDYRIFSERLVFTHFPETLDIHLASQVTLTDGRPMMTINIDTHDADGKPCPANLSLAVVADSMEYTSTRSDFKTYLFLESELKRGMIEHPRDYWNPDAPESLSYIELLLLTHGWCQYSQEDLWKESKAPAYPMEQGLLATDSLQNLPMEDESIQLDEVKVTGRKNDKFEKRRSYSDGFVKTIFDVGKNNYGDMRRLLGRVPGLTFVHSNKKIHVNGTPAGTTATFVLDGLVVHDSEMVYSMDASHIERIEVLQQTATMFGGFRSNGGIVVIYSMEIDSATVSNKEIHQWIGFSQTKKFYVPDH